MGPADARRQHLLDNAASSRAKMPMAAMHLSAHAFHRATQLARAIADPAGAKTIGVAHCAEAIQYRQRIPE